MSAEAETTPANGEQAGEPARVLERIAADLAAQGRVTAAALVRDVEARPVLGELVAAGPRAAERPAEYAYVIEAVHEGYLLHYGRPRLLAGGDPDLALLAGDYLYALGLRRLAELGDTAAVAELGDLISLAALCRVEGLEHCLGPLWLAGSVAVACGAGPDLQAAKEALRSRDPAADSLLLDRARASAERAALGDAFSIAVNAIDFPAVKGSNIG